MTKDAVGEFPPFEIEHSVDEIWDGATLLQRYNFLDLYFEDDDGYCRARAYVDEMDSVTLFGPFAQRTSLSKVERPSFEQYVLAYLERRFRVVRRL